MSGGARNEAEAAIKQLNGRVRYQEARMVSADAAPRRRNYVAVWRLEQLDAMHKVRQNIKGSTDFVFMKYKG